MNKIRLGVNIDHVATVRNARGENYPSPLKAALLAAKCGAHSITIHLREDRRHINDIDLKKIKSSLKVPLNLEIAATKEMVKIALKYKPDFICIVPEKISKLKKNNSRVSLFIEPNIKDIRISKNLNADCVEIHTGKICNLINKNKNYKKELNKIKTATILANNLGLEVHAGHGLTFKSAKILSKVKQIKEFNIGHFLIGESIFNGLKDTIKRFQKIL